jgi:hypothetical protein
MGNSYAPIRSDPTLCRTPLVGYGPAHLVVSGRRKNGMGDRPVMEKMAGEGPSRQPPQRRRHEAVDAADSGGCGGASPCT